MAKTRIITRSILIISLISFFTDISSEMLYPVLPLYLKSIGFSVILIGILEGIAEATAGLSKGYFGKLSDISNKRLPFVRSGYFLSCISKPMMVIFNFPLWVFTARTLDRLGKGIRTGARDALLSESTTSEHKGRVFGFHRSMDTLGAVIGPIFALIFLYFNPESYRILFFIAFIPGVIGIFFTFFIKEKTKESSYSIKTTSFFSSFKYLKESPKTYRYLIVGLLGFTFFNSSDVFLLLMIKQTGFNDINVITLYIFYNLIYALFSYPMGSLGDRIGLKPTFMIGLLIFSLVYLGMAINTSIHIFYVLFFFYGIYAASSEGIIKAWISNICDKRDVATAIGTYSGLNSIFTLFASSLAGIIWYSISPAATFIVSSIGSFGIFIYFLSKKLA